jgi:phage tail-like protein
VDANGTHYHLLLGYDDWARCSDGQTELRAAWERTQSPPDDSPPQDGDSTLAWDATRNELTLQPKLFNFIAAKGDVPPALEKRRGGGRDRYGNWYWIDETRQLIQVHSVGSNVTTDFWPLPQSTVCVDEQEAGAFQPKDAQPPVMPRTLSGLAVTDDHYLVVGTLAPAGLLIFDLHGAGGTPQQLLWPTDVEFTPFDMCPRPGGGVWILDREHKCYWAIDRHFNVLSLSGDAATLDETEDFQPVEPNPVPPRPAPPREPRLRITLDMAAQLDVLDPISIEALPDGSVLILGNRPGFAFSRVHRFLGPQELGRAVSTIAIIRLIEREQWRDFRLVGYDIAFVPQHASAQGTVPDRLYVAEAAGNQTWQPAQAGADVSSERIRLDPVAAFLPMRLFGGKGLNAAGDSVYYDFADGWLPLTEQRRPRYANEATLITDSFDGQEPDCVWHRLLLDACLPPETQVTVWSRAANDLNELNGATWLPEPQLYLRGDGSELPYTRRNGQSGAQGQQPTPDGRGTWELLFQRVSGRYLQLQLRLRGNERNTPRLRALRAYYPRFSYLNHYLPAVYREDDQSASFLDRFLANLEGLYTTLEDKIAAVQMLFDVRSAPADVLAWLASWFGIAFDPSWDEARQRMFIKHAMFFFQYRGTLLGLEMALSLALDKCVDDSVFTEQPQARRLRLRGVRIIEKFRSRPAARPLAETVVTTGPRLLTSAAARTPLAQATTGASRQLAATLKQFSLPARGGAFMPLGQTKLKQSAAWRQLAQTQLGFVPTASETDLPAWQNFLARRYQRIGALNQTYQTQYTSFDDVPLPSELPQGGPLLQDWYDFETVVLAMQRTAHRFTVLLPMTGTDSFNTDEQQRRVELTTRIINLEKPAHTIFDVKLYWAMFRVGEARLGTDSLLDLGSRAPLLMPPMVLGQEHLVESYLAPAYPQNVGDRFVIGRGPQSQSGCKCN